MRSLLNRSSTRSLRHICNASSRHMNCSRTFSTTPSHSIKSSDPSILAPNLPPPRPFDPSPPISSSNLNSAIGIPSSLPISQTAVLEKSIRKLAQRTPEIRNDEELALRVVLGKPVYFETEGEKLRVMALAKEVEAEYTAKRIIQKSRIERDVSAEIAKGDIIMPEEVKVEELTKGSGNNTLGKVADWSLRGITPKKIEGTDGEKDSSRQIDKAMFKNRSFDTLNVDRFKEKIEELM